MRAICCHQTTDEDTEIQGVARLRRRTDRGGIQIQVCPTPAATPLTASFYRQSHCGGRAPGPAARSAWPQALGAPPGLAQHACLRRALPPEPPPCGAHARSPAALLRALAPGGCGVPGSGRPAPRRRRTPAVARSSRTTSEPGHARDRAVPTRTPTQVLVSDPDPAPRSPLTWPSARRAPRAPPVAGGCWAGPR